VTGEVEFPGVRGEDVFALWGGSNVGVRVGA